MQTGVDCSEISVRFANYVEKWDFGWRFSNPVIKSHFFASRSFCGDKIECKLHFLASFQEIDAASNIQATEQLNTFTDPIRAKSNAVFF